MTEEKLVMDWGLPIRPQYTDRPFSHWRHDHDLTNVDCEGLFQVTRSTVTKWNGLRLTDLVGPARVVCALIDLYGLPHDWYDNH